MMGLVNRAIEAMAVKAGGPECWEQIRAKAGMEEPTCMSMKSYPDCLTYRLVGAASETLGMAPEEILKAFGKHWILFTGEEGYGPLMAMTGGDLKTFLSNLNRMHQQIGSMMPNMTPPKFDTEELESGTLRVHYHSEREGLAPMVVGLLEGLAERFDEKAEVAHVASSSDGADHDIFDIVLCSERVASA